MPLEQAFQLVPKAKVWIESPYIILPTEMSRFVSHLANNGQGDTALEFLQLLLILSPDPNASKFSISEAQPRLRDGLKKREGKTPNWYNGQ
ncbi:MAG: hypothetical protein ABI947_24045 [Chloroflexota bacterium]